ncbi:zinc finger protein 837-like [Dermacentor albipictus]|uniref:zinc finger protein 837-like n=1 Tax=Dermacentor albipictus TaxID=60249 RepID=UPI0038FCBD44
MSIVTRSRSRKNASAASATEESSARTPHGATEVTGEKDKQNNSADTSPLHNCDECGKAFNRWHHYRRHLALHLYEEAIRADCDAFVKRQLTGIAKHARAGPLLPVSTSLNDATARSSNAVVNGASLSLKDDARIPNGTKEVQSKPVDARGNVCGLCGTFFSRFHRYRRHLAMHAYEEAVAEEGDASKESKDAQDEHQWQREDGRLRRCPDGGSDCGPRHTPDSAKKASAGSSVSSQSSGKDPETSGPRPVPREVSSTSEGGARNETEETSQQCVCSVCNQVFVCQYTYHLRLPQGRRDGSHICPQCHRVFDDMGRLSLHRGDYTG